MPKEFNSLISNLDANLETICQRIAGFNNTGEFYEYPFFSEIEDKPAFFDAYPFFSEIEDKPAFFESVCSLSYTWKLQWFMQAMYARYRVDYTNDIDVKLFPEEEFIKKFYNYVEEKRTNTPRLYNPSVEKLDAILHQLGAIKNKFKESRKKNQAPENTEQ